MWNWISQLEELRSLGRPFIAVTVVHCTGSTPREVGAKMLVVEDTFFGTVGGGHLEELALKDARACLKEGVSRVIKYPLGAKTGQCCGGVVDLFMEVINDGPRLYLFGAGHVGQAVSRAFAGTPFQVHIIDEREEWISSREIPKDAIRYHDEWDEFAKQAEWHPEKTYVAIMTHRHDTDQDIVEYVIQKQTKFIGLIGSESKWERFKQRLTLKGVSMATLEKVKCPIGLDIGGKAPQEVAISVASEMLKIHYGR